MTGLTWVTSGSRRLRVRTAGDGPTVLLEAGGGHAGTTAWAPVIELLQDHARVIAYDRAGLGGSDTMRGSLNAQHHQDDLAAVLKAHAPASQPLVLVGWSLGALIVESYARTASHRIAGLLLIDPTPVELFTSHNPGWTALRAALRAAQLLTAARGIGRHPTSAPTSAARAELTALPATCRALREARVHQPVLTAPPVTVLTAELRTSRLHRRLLASAHDGTAAISTDGRLVVARGATHDIPGERPDLVVDHILQVLAHDRQPA